MTRRMGRPRVHTCTHALPDAHHGRCVKNARVRVIAEMTGRQMVMYRCWKHYVDLENKGRSSSSMHIIKVNVIGE